MINFDAPGDRDTYVHRIGRTGRAGATGTGVSFVLADQHQEMRKIAADLGLHTEYDANRGNAGDGVRAAFERQRAAPCNGNGNGQRRANGNGRQHSGGNRQRRRRRSRSR